MSDNLDNLLGDIYSSSSQSQGVKELANLINNLSQLLLKAISQLEGRVTKLEQALGRSPAPPRPAPARSAPAPSATPPAPKPKVASPFGAPQAPAHPTAPTPVAASSGPSSAAAAASMLGVTLKPAPKKEEAVAVSPISTSSGPAFLTGTVNATPTTPDAVAPSAAQPDAVAPASAGIAGPAGGFKGELAEKLERRRQ